MRRTLYILGALTLTTLVGTGIIYGSLFYIVAALNIESREFVDRAVPAITATWSEQQLLDRATPELRDSTSPEEFDATFAHLAQLGPLVAYDGAAGQATMSYVTGFGATVSASYEAKARFQNGNATIRIALRKRDGRWMIHSFFVEVASGSEEQPAI